MSKRDKKISNGIQKTINRGINFLAKGQEKDLPDGKAGGSFFCLVSTKFDDYRNANVVPAIVPTNIVLSSLAHITNSKTAKIKQKAAKFLLGERGEYWSFNYWFRKSDWYKKEPYPDDTDDTFCALAALYEYDSKLFDGEVMAKIVTMLTSAEEKEGGPYDMWLVPPKARNKWRDIDLVCNSNIAYFLSLQDISIPKLDAFIDKSIDEKDYKFPYNKIYPGIYFVSRFYEGKKIGKIVKLLLSKQKSDGRWENPLRTALAISSLINLEGFPEAERARYGAGRHQKQLEKGVEYLIKTQNQNGGWEPYSFYFQMRTKKKTLYAGSPFITTALCLEAINKFRIMNNELGIKNERKIKKTVTEEQDKLYRKIIEKTKSRFAELGKDLKKAAFEILEKTLKNDKDKQIVLLPYYFANSLRQNRNSIRPAGGHNSDLLIRLGEANLCGWIAYTIYDNFLDEEGDPKELPLANVCLRESAEIFGAVLPYATGFLTFSKKMFDTIDGANMWEVTNCRSNKFQITNHKSQTSSKSQIPNYGNYSQLANKSLGHALGPIAILFALGYKANSAEVRNTMRFFRNYIIARQLNDDAHDWEDDLKRGQVNAVAAMLLKDVKGNMLDPKKLREIFWHKTILGACKDILKHMEFAKKDLKKLSVMKNPEVFTEMLAAIEYSVEKALKEREETMKFLKAYKPH